MEGKLWPPRALDTLTLHALLSLAVNTDESSEEQALVLEKGGEGAWHFPDRVYRHDCPEVAGKNAEVEPADYSKP